MDATKVNKRVVEALIKSGSFSGFGLRRSQMLAIMDAAMDAAQAEQRDRATGQIGLFGEEELAATGAIAIPDLPEIPQEEILREEKELLGFYVTGHPLERYRESLQQVTPIAKCAPPEMVDGRKVVTGGIISELRVRSTKTGNGWQVSCWKI